MALTVSRLGAESGADAAPTLRYLDDETHVQNGLRACEMDARRDPFRRRTAARIEAGTSGTTNEDCGTTNENWGTTNKDWLTTNEDAVHTPVRDASQATPPGCGRRQARQNKPKRQTARRRQQRKRTPRGHKRVRLQAQKVKLTRTPYECSVSFVGNH